MDECVNEKIPESTGNYFALLLEAFFQCCNKKYRENLESLVLFDEHLEGVAGCEAENIHCLLCIFYCLLADFVIVYSSRYLYQFDTLYHQAH